MWCRGHALRKQIYYKNFLDFGAVNGSWTSGPSMQGVGGRREYTLNNVGDILGKWSM
jgi:hypothetical protein